MAFIVYQTNKKTGTVYAYRQEAYRDPVTKRPKSKKTYLGRVDPVTKQIVEKNTEGKRNRQKLGMDTVPLEQRSDKADELITRRAQLIELQKSQIAELTRINELMLKDFQKLKAILEQYQ